MRYYSVSSHSMVQGAGYVNYVSNDVYAKNKNDAKNIFVEWNAHNVDIIVDVVMTLRENVNMYIKKDNGIITLNRIL